MPMLDGWVPAAAAGSLMPVRHVRCITDIAVDSPDSELLVGDELCVIPPVCSVKCEHGSICSLAEKQSNGISSV